MAIQECLEAACEIVHTTKHNIEPNTHGPSTTDAEITLHTFAVDRGGSNEVSGVARVVGHADIWVFPVAVTARQRRI
jgi:hypothetical protein